MLFDLCMIVSADIFFFIMIGGEVTCKESLEGAEVFGEKIKVLKLAVLEQMSQPFDWQLHMYKLATVPS